MSHVPDPFQHEVTRIALAAAAMQPRHQLMISIDQRPRRDQVIQFPLPAHRNTLTDDDHRLTATRNPTSIR